MMMGAYNKIKDKSQATFSSCEAISQLKEQFRSDNDNVVEWFRSCWNLYLPGDSLYIETGTSCHDLFEDYQSWCLFVRTVGCNFKNFQDRIKRVIKDYDKRVQRVSVGGGRKRVVFGISKIEGNEFDGFYKKTGFVGRSYD
jgi:phage/plasmid-associated DNA primase